MNVQMVMEAFLIAFLLVSWSVVGGRFAQGALLATVVTVVAGIIVPLFSFPALRSGVSVGWKAASVLVILGTMNAFGLVRYADRLARPDTSVAEFIVTVSIAAVVIAPMLEAILFGKHFSLWHLSGYACAGLTIFLLSR